MTPSRGRHPDESLTLFFAAEFTNDHLEGGAEDGRGDRRSMAKKVITFEDDD